MQLALASTGHFHSWDEAGRTDAGPARKNISVWRVVVLCCGLVGTVAAAAAVWFLLLPATLVQTRIVIDGAGPAGRAALADAASRIGAGPGRFAVLDRHGESLVIAVRDDDPAIAWQRARSETDAVLNQAVPIVWHQADPTRNPGRSSERAGLLADRARLAAVGEAVDARAAGISAALTSIARDIAATNRAAAERRGGRETIERSTTALADLQLQRIQLGTRYQDDFPTVVALDGQIRNLRSFIQDETRRLDAEARVPPGDAVDPTLGAERDRLRAELAKLGERRSQAAAELVSVGQRLAALPAEGAATPQAAPAFIPPAPVLIEGATTLTSGPDNRWISVTAISVAGLLLTLAGWFKPRRHTQPIQAEILLQRLEAVIGQHGGSTALAPGLYPTLARPPKGMMLGTATAASDTRMEQPAELYRP